MRVLFIRSVSRSHMWYKDAIGRIVLYRGRTPEGDYWSQDNEGYKNIILDRDAFEGDYIPERPKTKYHFQLKF
jgi:hypothetical protein